MCGRYTFDPGAIDEFVVRYKIQNFDEVLEPRYNVAPGQIMPVVVRHSPNSVEFMKWGLVPFWAKDPRIGYKMINARAETLSVKPSFKKSLQSKRCLVPASGFYEWQNRGKEKQPYYIHLKSKGLFSFAGIYDVWKDAEGYPMRAYCIITTKPNKLMASIHDRMLVILRRDDESTWLDERVTEPAKLLELLQPYQASQMAAYQVSDKVNKPMNDSKELIKPLA